MIAYIDFLRFCAIVLVANSHFKGVYPTDILSFGGGFGLALFYMISGYLLSNTSKEKGFLGWYLKRLVKLYIPLWMIMGVETAIGYIKIDGLSKFISVFIFPGMWFTASMVVMYPLYYMFVRKVYAKSGNKSLKSAIGVLSISYFLMYFSRPKWCLFSFEFLSIMDKFSIETPYVITHTAWAVCMLMGLYIRKNWNSEKQIKAFNHVIMVGGSIALFFIIRIAERKLNIDFLELLLPVTYVAFSYAMFAICIAKEKTINKYMACGLGSFIGKISRSSIEIYYLQFIFIEKFRNIFFPMNWFVIVVSISISAIVFHKISDNIFKICIRKHI